MGGEEPERSRQREAGARRGRPTAAALLLALGFAAAVPLMVSLVPQQWTMRVITPAWMPTQLARVIELSSDLQAGLAADRLPAEHPAIRLVTVTEEALEPYPYLSPVDRGLLARLIAVIDAAGPRAMGLDFIFDKPTEPAKDAQLTAALRVARAPVVLGALDERIAMRPGRRQWQTDFITRAGGRVGFLNLRTDAQESSGNPIIRYRSRPPAGAALPQGFAEQLAAAGGFAGPDVAQRIAWLGRPREGGETFQTIDAGALITAAADPASPAGRILARELKDRIVIIGGDITGQDRHRTPLAPLDPSGMLGAEVHAHVLAQILDGRLREDLPVHLLLALAVPLAFLAVLIGIYLPAGRGWFMGALGAGVSLAVIEVAVLLTQFRYVVPAAILLFVVLAGLLVGRLAARLSHDRF